MKLLYCWTIISALWIATTHAEPRLTAELDANSVYQLQARWRTDEGRVFQLAELAGQYQIVAFIFTHCAAACPLLVKSLQQQWQRMPAQARERAGILLVSIDPQHDTAATLHQYRQTMELDARWTLLSGTSDAVRELTAVLGFNYQQLRDGQFTHSNQITLLDPHGTIVMQHPATADAMAALSDAIAASR